MGEGGVILINDSPHEIVSRVDAATLTVSLPRVRTSDAPIWTPDRPRPLPTRSAPSPTRPHPFTPR